MGGTFGKDVCPLFNILRRSVFCPVDQRHLLAREGKGDRPREVLDRHPPCMNDLVRVGRPEERDVRNRPERCELFDRLVCRSVLPQADAVMGIDINRTDAHHGGEPDGGAHVFGEDEEGPSVRDHTFRESDAVQNGSHGMFPDPEMKVPSGGMPGLELRQTLQVRIVGRGKVRGTADKCRQVRRDGIQYLAGGFPCGHGANFRPKDRESVFPCLTELLRTNVFELLRQVGMRPLIPSEHRVPEGIPFLPQFHGFPEMGKDLGRNVEMLLGIPAEVFLRESHLFLAQRRAVRFGGILFVRTPVADVRSYFDQGRPLGFVLRRLDGCVDCVEVIPILHCLDMPSVRCETGRRVLRERQSGVSIDADAVVVVQIDDVPQL